MSLHPWRRVAFTVLIFAASLKAQQTDAPVFDVVSIRVVPPNTPPTARDQYFSPILPGGEYIDSRTNLMVMICFAYNCKNPDKQMIGLPTWAKNQSYAIAAKPADGFPVPPPDQYRDQVRLMMRAMLADRFHLRLHTENRPESIYKLELAKGGMKLKEVDPPVPPAPTGNVNAAMRNDGGIRMIANKSTMERLAVSLSLLAGKPVIDETGLSGYYDFDVTWKGPEVPDGQAPERQFGGPELVGLLISNLQSQFGLHLASATGPVEYWVVDHVEPPTEN
jgi:uncharacterized protein (TIGR03435 family)